MDLERVLYEKMWGLKFTNGRRRKEACEERDKLPAVEIIRGKPFGLCPTKCGITHYRRLRPESNTGTHRERDRLECRLRCPSGSALDFATSRTSRNGRGTPRPARRRAGGFSTTKTFFPT